MIKKIKSSYILNQIFSYIPNDNIKFKLFKHSKLIQENLGIKLLDYKEKYVKQIGFNLDRYLFKDKNSNKETLKKRLNQFLKKKKLSINEIEEIVYDIYSNKKVKDLEEEDINTLGELPDTFIDVYSPFFDIISKTEMFQKKYCIPIIDEVIERDDLEDDYKKIFEKLNELDIKYASIIFYFDDNNNINYLKDFNIDFNKVKRLALIQYDIINKNDKYLFQTFFSLNNIESNLVYLKIYLEKENGVKTDSYSFEIINNFKSLRYLYIAYFYFDKTFLFKLKTLKLLSFEKCNNICLSEDCCCNLQRLTLNDTILDRGSHPLFKFPKLESCYFFDFDTDCNLFIDFKSLNSLKFFSGKLNNFLELESGSLESIIIVSNGENDSIDIENKTLEKIMNLKKLKTLRFGLSKENNNNIPKIKGENASITNLGINWVNDDEECDLTNLQKKFPNLSYIEIIIPKINEEPSNHFTIQKSAFININENKNCKVDKICMNIMGPYDIQFNCGPFEKLISVIFDFHPYIYGLEEIFPLFGNNCQIIFESLKEFKFTYKYGDILDNENLINILENIYNNLDKMPNLKEFLIECTCKVSEEFYMKFIKKLLSMNLNNIYFNINTGGKAKGGYSISELKNIYKDFDFYQYTNIAVNKF